MLDLTPHFDMSMSRPFQHLDAFVFNREIPRKNTLLPPVDINIETPEEIEKLSKAVGQWITDEGWEFSCQGINISTDEMSSVDGLLPLVLRQASICVGQVFGKEPSRGVEHGESELALCSVYVSSLHDLSLAQWLLVATYALEEHVKKNKPEHGPVPIDEWYAAWTQDYEAQKIVIRQPSLGVNVRA